jgi:hypothetical protein
MHEGHHTQPDEYAGIEYALDTGRLRRILAIRLFCNAFRWWVHVGVCGLGTIPPPVRLVLHVRGSMIHKERFLICCQSCNYGWMFALVEALGRAESVNSVPRNSSRLIWMGWPVVSTPIVAAGTAGHAIDRSPLPGSFAASQPVSNP